MDNCKPSEDCKDFIREEIKKELSKESSQREEELRKESKQRLEFERMITAKVDTIEKISRENQETIKSLNIVTLSKLEEIKDTKEIINKKVDNVEGKIEMVVEFMQNRGRFERFLSWVPRKWRGPAIIIALFGIVVFVMKYGQPILDIVKLRWGK